MIIIRDLIDGILLTISFIWTLLIFIATAILSLFFLAMIYGNLAGADLTAEVRLDFDLAIFFMTLISFMSLFSFVSLKMLFRCVDRIKHESNN